MSAIGATAAATDWSGFAECAVDMLLREHPPLPYANGKPSNWWNDLSSAHPEMVRVKPSETSEWDSAVVTAMLQRDEAYLTDWAAILCCERPRIARPKNASIVALIGASKSNANVNALQWFLNTPVEEEFLPRLIKALVIATRGFPTTYRIYGLSEKIRSSGNEAIDRAVTILLEAKEIDFAEAVSIRQYFLTPKALPNIVAEWAALSFNGFESERTSRESLYKRFGEVAFYLARSRSIAAFEIILNGMRSDDDLVSNFSLFVAGGYALQEKPRTVFEWERWYVNFKQKGTIMPTWIPPKGRRHSAETDLPPGRGDF